MLDIKRAAERVLVSVGEGLLGWGKGFQVLVPNTWLWVKLNRASRFQIELRGLENDRIQLPGELLLSRDYKNGAVRLNWKIFAPMNNIEHTISMRFAFSEIK